MVRVARPRSPWRRTRDPYGCSSPRSAPDAGRSCDPEVPRVLLQYRRSSGCQRRRARRATALVPLATMPRPFRRTRSPRGRSRYGGRLPTGRRICARCPASAATRGAVLSSRTARRRCSTPRPPRAHARLPGARPAARARGGAGRTPVERLSWISPSARPAGAARLNQPSWNLGRLVLARKPKCPPAPCAVLRDYPFPTRPLISRVRRVFQESPRLPGLPSAGEWGPWLCPPFIGVAAALPGPEVVFTPSAGAGALEGLWEFPGGKRDAGRVAGVFNAS